LKDFNLHFTIANLQLLLFLADELPHLNTAHKAALRLGNVTSAITTGEDIVHCLSIACAGASQTGDDISAVERIIANGFALFWPAMSGAVP
jgi:hypothetical protein